MPTRDISQTTATDFKNYVDDVEIDTKSLLTPSEKETRVGNSDFPKWYGYFLQVPEVHSAWIMKSNWIIGKGYEVKNARKAEELDLITGNGYQTFQDLLFNAHLIMKINGRSYTEKVFDKEGNLINLKTLDPQRVTDIYNQQGRITAFEYTQPTGKMKRFKPEEIFFLQNCNLGLQGVSPLEPLEKSILAMNEAFSDAKKIMRYQGRPFILWKLKTDDQTKIDAWLVKLQNARNLGEDLAIPDDDGTVEHEVIQIQPSPFISEWRNSLIRGFYRQIGMPLVLFGQAESTESGSKMEVWGHETVWKAEQKYIEDQVKAQLGIELKLVPPQSLLPNLQTDEMKDKNQGLEMQQGDITPGVNKQ